MYIYRKLPTEEQEELLRLRKLRGLPAHEPPHYPSGTQIYFVTGTCFEHAHILSTANRREEFADELHARLPDIHAWVVLPNHYHLVLTCNLKDLKAILADLYNWTATKWNREDNSVGRKVWYRFVDRGIRSRSHYFASVNYVHWNPVKHSWADKLQNWPTSSFTAWLNLHGRDEMVRLWRTYPIRDYGKGWDV